jgi:hypothetical protein
MVERKKKKVRTHRTGGAKAARARREFKLLRECGNTDSMYLTPWLRYPK